MQSLAILLPNPPPKEREGCGDGVSRSLAMERRRRRDYGMNEKPGKQKRGFRVRKLGHVLEA